MMLSQIKPLVVVLLFALVMFSLARPTFVRFMADSDYVRRRNVWLALTTAAFLSPSFWVYFFIAAPTMVWAGRKDSNPLALYLMLYLLIPPMDVDIPAIGIGQVFPLNQARLLNLTVLLPAICTRDSEPSTGRKHGATAADILLLAFGALHLLVFIPYESITNTIRRAILYGIDVYIVYYAFSRLSRRPETSTDALGALTLTAIILAPIGAFESIRQWLLFTGISANWGVPNEFSWLLRGDKLRAQASTGHALGLGWLLAMGTGFWMYLRTTEPSRIRSFWVFILFTVGLFFTYSRGPWMMATLIPLCYLAMTSRDVASFAKKILAFGLIAAIFLATPLGSDVADKLPFIGNADQDTVEYRRQLAETSWRLIQEHPLFGNPFVLLEMEELRQGQGIIDMVNGFTTIALYYGLVGLTLYVGALLIPTLRCFSRFRLARAQGDGPVTIHSAVLIACMIGTIFYIASTGPTWFQWALIGLMTSCTQWATTLDQTSSTWSSVNPRTGTVHAEPAA